MPDGVAWCVCCELLIDDRTSRFPGNQQTSTPEDSVCLEALWTSGITFADMKKLAADNPGSITLLGQWDPASEINPDHVEEAGMRSRSALTQAVFQRSRPPLTLSSKNGPSTTEEVPIDVEDTASSETLEYGKRSDLSNMIPGSDN